MSRPRQPADEAAPLLAAVLLFYLGCLLMFRRLSALLGPARGPAAPEEEEADVRKLRTGQIILDNKDLIREVFTVDSTRVGGPPPDEGQRVSCKISEIVEARYEKERRRSQRPAAADDTQSNKSVATDSGEAVTPIVEPKRLLLENGGAVKKTVSGEVKRTDNSSSGQDDKSSETALVVNVNNKPAEQVSPARVSHGKKRQAPAPPKPPPAAAEPIKSNGTPALHKPPEQLPKLEVAPTRTTEVEKQKSHAAGETACEIIPEVDKVKGASESISIGASEKVKPVAVEPQKGEPEVKRPLSLVEFGKQNSEPAEDQTEKLMKISSEIKLAIAEFRGKAEGGGQLANKGIAEADQRSQGQGCIPLGAGNAVLLDKCVSGVQVGEKATAQDKPVVQVENVNSKEEKTASLALVEAAKQVDNKDVTILTNNAEANKEIASVKAESVSSEVIPAETSTAAAEKKEENAPRAVVPVEISSQKPPVSTGDTNSVACPADTALTLVANGPSETPAATATSETKSASSDVHALQSKNALPESVKTAQEIARPHPENAKPLPQTVKLPDAKTNSPEGKEIIKEAEKLTPVITKNVISPSEKINSPADKPQEKSNLATETVTPPPGTRKSPEETAKPSAGTVILAPETTKSAQVENKPTLATGKSHPETEKSLPAIAKSLPDKAISVSESLKSPDKVESSPETVKFPVEPKISPPETSTSTPESPIIKVNATTEEILKPTEGKPISQETAKTSAGIVTLAPETKSSPVENKPTLAAEKSLSETDKPLPAVAASLPEKAISVSESLKSPDKVKSSPETVKYPVETKISLPETTKSTSESPVIKVNATTDEISKPTEGKQISQETAKTKSETKIERKPPIVTAEKTSPEAKQAIADIKIKGEALNCEEAAAKCEPQAGPLKEAPTQNLESRPAEDNSIEEKPKAIESAQLQVQEATELTLPNSASDINNANAVQPAPTKSETKVDSSCAAAVIKLEEKATDNNILVSAEIKSGAASVAEESKTEAPELKVEEQKAPKLDVPAQVVKTEDAPKEADKSEVSDLKANSEITKLENTFEVVKTQEEPKLERPKPIQETGVKEEQNVKINGAVKSEALETKENSNSQIQPKFEPEETRHLGPPKVETESHSADVPKTAETPNPSKVEERPIESQISKPIETLKVEVSNGTTAANCNGEPKGEKPPTKSDAADEGGDEDHLMKKIESFLVTESNDDDEEVDMSEAAVKLDTRNRDNCIKVKRVSSFKKSGAPSEKSKVVARKSGSKQEADGQLEIAGENDRSESEGQLATLGGKNVEACGIQSGKVNSNADKKIKQDDATKLAASAGKQPTQPAPKIGFGVLRPRPKSGGQFNFDPQPQPQSDELSEVFNKIVLRKAEERRKSDGAVKSRSEAKISRTGSRKTKERKQEANGVKEKSPSKTRETSPIKNGQDRKLKTGEKTKTEETAKTELITESKPSADKTRETSPRKSVQDNNLKTDVKAITEVKTEQISNVKPTTEKTREPSPVKKEQESKLKTEETVKIVENIKAGESFKTEATSDVKSNVAKTRESSPLKKTQDSKVQTEKEAKPDEKTKIFEISKTEQSSGLKANAEANNNASQVQTEKAAAKESSGGAVAKVEQLLPSVANSAVSDAVRPDLCAAKKEADKSTACEPQKTNSSPINIKAGTEAVAASETKRDASKSETASEARKVVPPAITNKDAGKVAEKPVEITRLVRRSSKSPVKNVSKVGISEAKPTVGTKEAIQIEKIGDVAESTVRGKLVLGQKLDKDVQPQSSSSGQKEAESAKRPESVCDRVAKRLEHIRAAKEADKERPKAPPESSKPVNIETDATRVVEEQQDTKKEPVEAAKMKVDGAEGGGIGLVVANTGRKVGDTRYLTEMQVFFRSGVLGQLEAQRDEKLQDHVTRLQARCKGYLARRRFEKRKVQEVAIRCVQRNVRRFVKVRDWPWWRLLVRVAPLLNVHRAEEELRKQTEELEGLKMRLDKSEAEKLRLKQHNERLEARMNELTVALSEEQSASHLAAERLENESSERSRLQHELQNAQEKQSSLREASQRLEMEILMCRATDDSSHTSGDDDDAGYEHLKQRLDRAVKEAAALRRQLQQQQENHEDQLMAQRKATEKRVADALEEVEEQRQVVAQMKRKAQRVTSEHNDTRLMLEEQSARNTILEKRQKKFDSEMHQLQDSLRQEKSAKEKSQRERDLMAAEKTAAEQNLAACRLELEMRDEKVAVLGRELEELAFGGAAEEEVAALRKSKHALERRVKEQEEELDELAGQVGLLEAAKVRLEMTLEQQRKESKREASQRDDELEEIRGNAHKKVRALESQLEAEHEERTRLLRDKHDLERRLAEAAEVARGRAPEDEQTIQRLRRELRHAKALLRDAHGLLERQRDETGGRGQLRALRHQLEDAEAARAVAMKARQTAEAEARELQAALEEEKRGRGLAEDKAAAAVRAKTEVSGQLEENEEELAEVMKKYKASVAQIGVEQAATTELAVTAATLEAERNSLREQVAEMSARLEAAEGDTTTGLTARRLETKIRELESRLELEATTRARAETQSGRFREQAEKMAAEAEAARLKEAAANDAARRSARQLREAREREANVAAKEAEAIRKRKEIEMRVETAEAEAAQARADLRLALQRIEDLQAAMAGDSEDLGSESSGSIESLLDSVGGSQEFLDFACRSPEGQSDPGDGVGHLTDSKDESHA